MKRIFITGGTGFIGKHMLRKLCGQGEYSLVALTRQKRDSKKNLVYLQGDISDTSLINHGIEQSDYVVHMAGCKNDPRFFYQVNVKGTQNIIDACEKNCSLKRLIYLSSVGVIGNSANIVIDEKTTCQPGNAYEKTKLQAELIVKKYSQQNPQKVITLRPTNVFGEDDPEKHLLNLFTKIKNNRFCFVGRDRSQFYLNYLYVKEISELIFSLLSVDVASDIYIINTPVKLNDFIAAIKEKIADDRPIMHLPYWPVKMLVSVLDWAAKLTNCSMPINSAKLVELTNRKIYSASLLQNDMGWKPAFNIKDAISNVTDHYRKQGLLS
ncbi:MAG: NAD(P)-dependent oxidoreductase [Candidatus Omnitrophica bacterium]|nr:NAD(P)-dependent oxidoreductase [Candidatus Omnitrophota bacterium]